MTTYCRVYLYDLQLILYSVCLSTIIYGNKDIFDIFCQFKSKHFSLKKSIHKVVTKYVDNFFVSKENNALHGLILMSKENIMSHGDILVSKENIVLHRGFGE